MKLKLDDKVIVIAGKDKGKTGEVIKVLRDKNKVIVKGINQIKRHVKARDGIEGGIVTIEKPLPTSNVALIDPKTKKASKTGYKIVKNKKVRFFKNSGTTESKSTKKVADKKTTKKSTKK